jgi:hypothetical protein
MKCDAMGCSNAAMSLKKCDPSTAFALPEGFTHLRMLMRGEATLAEWNAAYVGADARLTISANSSLSPPDPSAR